LLSMFHQCHIRLAVGENLNRLTVVVHTAD